MMSKLWKRLWEMHDATKSLVFFEPKTLLAQASNETLMFSDSHQEQDADLTEELMDAPAEHSPRLKSEPQGVKEEEPREYTTRQKFGLVLGPVLFLAILLLPTPTGMTPEGKKMAAVALLMACWWMCESIPIPATSLLPIALFPLLGIMHINQATAPYSSHLIYLFMGGFIIALSMQRWNLHRRIAMNIIKVVGFAPNRLILGFMVSTAVLSAFVSNTATAVMMLPIGLAIITHVTDEGKKEGLDAKIDFSPEQFAFGLNLMLGIAYGATIGGIATLIGSPPNTVLAGYMQKTFGYEVTFLSWMKIGVPLVAVMLPLCWIWLTRFANPMKLKKVPGGRELINKELKEMGPLNTGERWTALVFGLTAFGWIFRKKLAFIFPDPNMLTDASIAMIGAFVLFCIPINLRKNIFVMDWHWASKMPWGVLLLFGGGLSMAGGVKATKLAEWIGSQVAHFSDSSPMVIVLATTVIIIMLTEMTSNTATAAMSMPVLSAVALGLGQNPLLLCIPAAITSSCAFSMPVATPPNAIVFGSGYVTVPQMVRSGLGLNFLGIVFTVAVTYFIVIPTFDIVFGQLPDWAQMVK